MSWWSIRGIVATNLYQKNKIDYLNFHFHIEKKCCSYIPICQKVIFIFDIFLNFPTCDIFRDVRHFLEKKKIWSAATKLWFMKLAYFTQKKLENKILHYTKPLSFMIHWIPWNISPTQKKNFFWNARKWIIFIALLYKWLFPKIKVWSD